MVSLSKHPHSSPAFRDGLQRIGLQRMQYVRVFATQIDRQPDALEKVARRSLYAGLALSSLLVFRVATVTFGDVLLLLSALLTIISRAPEGQKARSLYWLVTSCLAFGGVAAADRSLSPSGDILTLGRAVVVVVILPWQARRLLTTPPFVYRALAAFLVGATVSAAGTLLQAEGFAISGSSQEVAGRLSGFTAHVSDLGGIAAVGVVLAIALSRPDRQRLTRLSLLAALAVNAIGLILTGSVSGILAAGAGVFVLLLRRGMRLRRLLVLSVVVYIVFHYAVAIQAQQGALTPLQRFEQAVGLTASVPGTDTNTLGIRQATYGVAWKGFQEHPVFGAGLDDQSGLVLGDLGAHNLLLAGTYQGGVVFGFGLLLAIAAAIRAGWRNNSPLGARTFAMLITATTFAMTGPSFYNRYFWIPVALTVAAAAVDKGKLSGSEMAFNNRATS